MLLLQCSNCVLLVRSMSMARSKVHWHGVIANRLWLQMSIDGCINALSINAWRKEYEIFNSASEIAIKTTVDGEIFASLFIFAILWVTVFPKFWIQGMSTTNSQMPRVKISYDLNRKPCIYLHLTTNLRLILTMF